MIRIRVASENEVELPKALASLRSELDGFKAKINDLRCEAGPIGPAGPRGPAGPLGPVRMYVTSTEAEQRLLLRQLKRATQSSNARDVVSILEDRGGRAYASWRRSLAV